MSSLLSFWKKRSPTLVFMVCDIGVGGVAIGIVETNATEKLPARVLLSERRSLAFSGKQRDERQTIEQLGTLVQELGTTVLSTHVKAGGAPINEIICFIHAPWVHTEATYSERVFERPTTITAELIGEVANEASRKKNTLPDADVFEKVVTRILLNGYRTRKPERKEAFRLGVSVLMSSMHDGMRQALNQALGATVPGRTIVYQSASFVLGVVIEEYAHNPENYTLVDITSDITSASVMRAGSLLTYATGDVGWRTIIEKLSADSQTQPEEILSKVRMVAEDTCSDAVCSELLDALKKAEPTFVNAYGKMLATLAGSERLPGAIVLIAPPDVGDWFTNLFSRVDFAQFTIAERPFIVEQLFAQFLERSIKFKEGLRLDTGIAVAAGFVHMRVRDND